MDSNGMSWLGGYLCPGSDNGLRVPGAANYHPLNPYSQPVLKRNLWHQCNDSLPQQTHCHAVCRHNFSLRPSFTRVFSRKLFSFQSQFSLFCEPQNTKQISWQVFLQKPNKRSELLLSPQILPFKPAIFELWFVLELLVWIFDFLAVFVIIFLVPSTFPRKSREPRQGSTQIFGRTPQTSVRHARLGIAVSKATCTRVSLEQNVPHWHLSFNAPRPKHLFQTPKWQSASDPNCHIPSPNTVRELARANHDVLTNNHQSHNETSSSLGPHELTGDQCCRRLRLLLRQFIPRGWGVTGSFKSMRVELMRHHPDIRHHQNWLLHGTPSHCSARAQHLMTTATHLLDPPSPTPVTRPTWCHVVLGLIPSDT